MPIMPEMAYNIISIHALREEGDLVIADFSAHLWISIHALREEGDGTTLNTLWAR